jgi:hypothetical protein
VKRYFLRTIFSSCSSGLRMFGPKEADHSGVGEICYACGRPFKIGDYTTLVPLGPGADVEERQECAVGRWYNAVGIEIHWSCATGKDPCPGDS